MHSCNIPQTNSNFLVGQLQFVFKQFTLNEKSCSTSTQKTGKVRIIQTFVSVKSSAWDTVSLSNRLYFTTSKNKEIQHVIKKIHPNKNLPALQAAQLSTTSKKQMVQVKRVTNKLGGEKKKKKQTKPPPIHYMTDHLELYKFTKSWELQSTQMLP